MKTQKRAILHITGTRAEYGLARRFILALQKSKGLAPKILATGMHTLKQFGDTVQLIKIDNVPIASVVKVSAKNDMIQDLIQEIEGVRTYCVRAKPDAIIVVGDRSESFAASIVGLYLHIPVIHFSGGDVSASIDNYLRNATTLFSNLHFVQTQKSKSNVLRLGADPKTVWIAGSLGLDGLRTSTLFAKREIAKSLKLNEKDYWYLVVFHPTLFENISFPSQIDPLLLALKKLRGEKIITYPNSDTGGRYFLKRMIVLSHKKGFHLYPNIDRTMYLSLMKRCDVLIGNTSSGLMEAGYLKVPFVKIGNRQGGREQGDNVISADYNTEHILASVKKALSKKFRQKIRSATSPYRGDPVAAKSIVRIEKYLLEQNNKRKTKKQ